MCLEKLPSGKCSKELPTMSIILMIDGRGAFCASRFIDKSKVVHMLEEDITADVLRQDISRIVATRDFL